MSLLLYNMQSKTQPIHHEGAGTQEVTLKQLREGLVTCWLSGSGYSVTELRITLSFQKEIH